MLQCIVAGYSWKCWIEIFCLGIVKSRDGVVWSRVRAGKQPSLSVVPSVVSRNCWIEIFCLKIVRSRVCAYQIRYPSVRAGKQPSLSVVPSAVLRNCWIEIFCLRIVKSRDGVVWSRVVHIKLDAVHGSTSVFIRAYWSPAAADESLRTRSSHCIVCS